jgi:DNA-binding CsgD family transcriptional regulator
MYDTHTWQQQAAMKRVPGTGTPAYALLDHFAIAAFVITVGCRVLYENSGGHRLLTSGDGINTVRGRVRITGAPAARAFREAVARSDRNAFTERQVVHVPRPSGLPALVLCLTAIHEDIVVVYAIDVARAPAVDVDLLRAAHGLSKAESRVVAALVRTQDVRGVAAELGVSPHTVRTHLKSIMVKFGTHRQSELVRIVTAGVGAFSLASEAKNYRKQAMRSP